MLIPKKGPRQKYYVQARRPLTTYHHHRDQVHQIGFADMHRAIFVGDHAECHAVDFAVDG